MDDNEQSVRQVIGENVRRLRIQAGARQDDVATAARDDGLSWNRSKVAALERGDKALDVAETVLLAEALARVTKQPVSLADLLDGTGPVRLSRTVVLHRRALRRVLDGGPVRFLVKDVPGAPEHVPVALKSAAADLRRMAQLAGPDVRLDLIEGLATRAGEVEERAGRALGLSRVEVAYLAVGLWGRTLAEERDRRVGKVPDVASRSARRGRETRQLVEELQIRLSEVEHGER